MIPLLKAPPSKSLTHRALFCSALAFGESVILNPLLCDDTLVTARVLEAFGVSIQKEKRRWIVTGGRWKTPVAPIDCNESGTTYRFLKAITEALQIKCELTGKPSLLKRPIDSANTSQFLSGRLIAMRKCPEPIVSKPYVKLTMDVQKKFGVDVREIKPQQYRPAIVEIEGDWSSSSFLLAAGVLTRGVVVEGLNPDSLQGDRAVFDILKEMGADIFWEDGKLVARPSSLRAIEWDFSQTPDLYPIVAVLCHLAKGKSVLKGIDRLRFKESDRVAAMEQVLTSTVIDSDDHRIVMAAAVLNLATGGKMVIKNPQCVAKSFPDFWKTLESI